MKTGFLFDEWCFWHSAGLYALTLPVGGWVQPLSGSSHVDSPESKRRFKNLMDVSGLSKQLQLSSAEAVTDEDLIRVHSSAYLQHLKQISDQGGGLMGVEASFGLRSYEIAKISAGLAAAAVEKVYLGEVKNAYALCRPSGHHCLPDQAMGFCFLSNIAIAIERAKAKFGLGKVAVVDWDVHHGNGTQHIYYQRNDVLTISIHQDKCFPPGYRGDRDVGVGGGKGFNINIPLLAGAGHNAYIYALKKIVLPALDKFKPEMIVVACGFDGNAYDPLARQLLHSDSFRQMTALTMQAAERLCAGKLALVHEGGHAESYVPFCGLAVMEQLSGIQTAVVDPSLDFVKMQQPGKEFDALQQQLLDDLANQLHPHAIVET